jgi:hypothetical protein
VSQLMGYSKLVNETFEQIKAECHPDSSKSEFEVFGDIFDMFFGQIPDKKTNFIGGCNDNRNTLHENLFGVMYPELQKQVVFGTGEGGYEKYHSKKFIADFCDHENKVIYEIDGNSHKEYYRRLMDRMRDCFFYIEHGIQTVRITNERVEEMVLERLERLEAQGRLKEMA